MPAGKIAQPENNDEFFQLMLEINIRLRAISEDLCKNFGITSVEGRLLAAIEDQQQLGMIQRAIAQRAHLKPSAVTRMITGMEDAGLIFRVDDPENARQKRVFLTEQGSQIVAQFHQQIQQKYGETLEILDHKERTQLLEILRRIAENLQ